MTIKSESQPSFCFPDKKDADKFKHRVQRFYEFLNQKLNSSIYGEYAIFMNWGYEPNQYPCYATVELPEYFLNKRSTRLILELVGDCDIQNTRVLDVGCGRGGTLYTLSQFYETKSLTGIDITEANIKFCQENLSEKGIIFLQGDAENLPFSEGEIEVVINVESSHVYPNLFSFYREVYRVLKPGGYFLYTDIFPNAELPDFISYLKSLGFSLEVDRDITSNVILSRDLDAENQMGAFTGLDTAAENGEEQEDARATAHVMALPGSDLYDRLKRQEYSYRIYRWMKPKS